MSVPKLLVLAAEYAVPLVCRPEVSIDATGFNATNLNYLATWLETVADLQHAAGQRPQALLRFAARWDVLSAEVE